MDKLTLTKEEARRFLIRYHHLTDDTALESLDAVPDFVRKVGCIQFDPLDQVGKNPCLVIQSRLPGYKKGELDKLLYEERKLFDVWDKNMAICPVEDWPYMTRYRQRHRPRAEEYADAIAVASEYLQKHEYVSSSDVPLEGKVEWWGTQSMARVTLECMSYIGAAVVHHKVGTRRYYSLPERVIPREYLEMDDPNETEEDKSKWQVRRRINGIGMLWNRGGDAWLGLYDFPARQRDLGFQLLEQEGAILPAEVEGIKHPMYIDRNNLELLEQYRGKDIPISNVRIIGPLDNFVWERKLMLELFDMDYKWEVYTPKDQRKYGYYVLPVLAGDRFIGRVELVTDKAEKALVMKNFWWEQDLPHPKKEYRPHIKAALGRFKEYNRCKKVVYEGKL